MTPNPEFYAWVWHFATLQSECRLMFRYVLSPKGKCYPIFQVIKRLKGWWFQKMKRQDEKGGGHRFPHN